MIKDPQRHLKIILLSHFPFPNGQAVTNRMISYARGLVEAGHEVEVLTLKPTEIASQVRNKEIKGDFLGIPYRYTSGTSIVQPNVFRRIFLNLKGYFTALKIIKGDKDVSPADLILMVGPQNLLRTLGIWIVTRIFKISFWQERSEYPFITNKPGIRFKIGLFFYLHFTCSLFDGMILITKALQNYFRPRLSKKARIYLLPILVEPDRFATAIEKTPGYPYIAYCGSMEGEKDGIPDLISSFRRIAPDFLKHKLVLIGNTRFPGFAELQKQIDTAGLKDRIVFTGNLGRDELPSWLKGAEALVLARPANKQAEGGFPTKLGEYLASGRPVVVTRTGEIPEFLTDMKDAYLATPGDPEDVAAKLRLLLSFPDQASRIGKAGLETARRCFSYKEQSARMGEFFVENI